MSDLDYWKKMRLLTTERITYFESMLATMTVTTKWAWFIQSLLQSNRVWNRLAEHNIKEISEDAERSLRFRQLQRVTFRGK